MDTLIVHALNALLYASVMFLDRGRALPHLRRHAHRQSRPRQSLRVRRLRGRVGGGRSSSATCPSVLGYLAPRRGRGRGGRTGRRARAHAPAARSTSRAEEYQLLITFGLLLILEDLMRLIWGPYPLSVSALYEAMGSLTVGESIYPTYNLAGHRRGRDRRRRALGLRLPHAVRRGAARHLPESCAWPPRSGVNVNRVYVQAFTLGLLHGRARRAPSWCPSRARCSAWAWTRSSSPSWSWSSAGSGSLEGALVGALLVGVVRGARHHLLPGDRAGGALPHGRDGAARPAGRPLRARMSPLGTRSRDLLAVRPSRA